MTASSGGLDLPPRVRRDHIEPLWDRIERNRVRVGAFIALFVAGAAASAAVIVGAAGAFLGVVLVPPAGTVQFFATLPWIVLGALTAGAAGAGLYVRQMLSAPETRLLELFGARRSATGAFAATKSALHDMATAAGFEFPPGLWVIDDCDRVNAFVIGLDEEDAVVGVTRGFVKRLSEDDQRAVFANLMSRLCAGDVRWATAVSAIMGPIWKLREVQYRAQEKLEDDGSDRPVAGPGSGNPGSGAVGLFVFGMLGVILTELLMAGHQRAALAAAEKADAEGMLLLKDPAAMLAGLSHVLNADNTVPGAGEAYSMLFYCWAGFGYAPEDDPEMERVPRLREVLGAEGMGTADRAARA